VCALAGNLECNIVWGVALNLKSCCRQVVEVLVEQLNSVSSDQFMELRRVFLTSLEDLEISAKAGTDILKVDEERIDELRRL
jgi:hypothetical protein